MAKHGSVAVNEVVLFKRVQDDGYSAVEHLAKLRVREPEITESIFLWLL